MPPFADLISALRSREKLQMIEPEVEKLSGEKQRELREQQELSSGAVRTGVLAEGSEDGATPARGDVVCFHYTIREDGLAKELASSRRHLGGPCVAAIDSKGTRIPRGWELAMQSMKVGQRNAVITAPSFGFEGSECTMPMPEGVKASMTLATEIELLHVVPQAQGKPLPVDPSIIKVTDRRGKGWETPRELFQVEFAVSLQPTSELTSSFDAPSGSTSQDENCKRQNATLGSATLPEGVETCLSSMAAGERARFVVPRKQLMLRDGGEWCGGDSANALPAGETVLLLLELASFVEVRNMTGDKKVLKMKTQPGKGNFPMDAPINDATATIHYSIWHAQAESLVPEGPALFSTRDRGAGHDESGEPLVVSTGEGALPSGIEMAIKLMLPGECCNVVMQPEYGYGTCAETPPAGVDAKQALLVQLELISFEKDGHPQAMEADQLLSYVEKHKAKANELYKMDRINFALKKYEKAYNTLCSCRDIHTDEQFERSNALKVALLSNLAAALMAQKDYPEAIRRCDKALELEPHDPKIHLRKARAQSLNGDFDDCRATCVTLQSLPGYDQVDEAVQELLKNTRAREHAASSKQKTEFRNFFERKGA